MAKPYPDIANLLRDFNALSEGKHIAYDPPYSKSIKDQLERMYEYDALTTRPSLFFNDASGLTDDRVISGDPDKAEEHKINIRHHPLAEESWAKIKELKARIPEQYYITGSSPIKRERGRQASAFSKNHGGYLIPPHGDIVCAREMLELLNARLTSDPRDDGKPIIIFNQGDYWKHLLEACLGIRLGDGVKEPFGHDKKIWVADDWKSLNNAIEQANAVDTPSAPKPLIPPGSTLLVATKTNEKVYELQKMFKGLDVRIIRLDHAANFSDPLEESCTFSGNAIEKIQSGREALAKQPLQMLKDTLEWNFIDPNKLFIVSEDSGLYADEHKLLPFMQATGRFGKLGVPEGKIFYPDQFPGVESGPVFNGSLGELTFMTAVNEALKQMREIVEKVRRHRADPLQPLSESDRAIYDDCLKRVDKDGKEMDPTVKNNITSASVLALTPFKIGEENTHQPIYTFSGVTHNILLPEARAEKGTVVNVGHYLVPTDQHSSWLSKDTRKTQDELGDEYLAKYSARSHAAQVLQETTGLSQHLRTAPLPHHKVTVGITNSDVARNFSRDDVEKEVSLPKFVFSRGSYTPETRADKNWIDQSERTAASADVYYLTPRRADANMKSRLHDMYRLFSLIVTKQLTPRDKDKPIVVDANDRSWDDYLNLYDDLRKVSMASDQQNTFITRFKNEQELNDAITITARNKFIGNKSAMAADIQSHGEELLDKKDFNVAVFCSATSKNGSLRKDAFDLGSEIAARDHGLVYGAADRNMMGAVRDGFLETRRNKAASRTPNAKLIGSSTPDIIQVESDAAAEDVVEKMDVYHHADTIYERMAFMFKQSSAFTIIPGGAGTIQELTALLCAKEAKHPDLKNKPIIIYNCKLPIDMEGHTQKQGFYQPMIDMLGGKKALESVFNVTVCDTYEEVLAGIDKAAEKHKSCPSRC